MSNVTYQCDDSAVRILRHSKQVGVVYGNTGRALVELLNASQRPKPSEWQDGYRAGLEAGASFVNDNFRKEGQPAATSLIGMNGYVYFADDVAREIRALLIPAPANDNDRGTKATTAA